MPTAATGEAAASDERVCAAAAAAAALPAPCASTLRGPKFTTFMSCCGRAAMVAPSCSVTLRTAEFTMRPAAAGRAALAGVDGAVSPVRTMLTVMERNTSSGTRNGVSSSTSGSACTPLEVELSTLVAGSAGSVVSELSALAMPKPPPPPLQVLDTLDTGKRALPRRLCFPLDAGDATAEFVVEAVRADAAAARAGVGAGAERQ